MKKVFLVIIISAFSFAAGYQIGGGEINNSQYFQMPADNSCPYLKNENSNAKKDECPYLNNEENSQKKCPFNDGKIEKSNSKSKNLKLV